MELEFEVAADFDLAKVRLLSALRDGRSRTQTVKLVWHDTPDYALQRQGLTVAEERGGWQLEQLAPGTGSWLPAQSPPIIQSVADPAWLSLGAPLIPVAAFEGRRNISVYRVAPGPPASSPAEAPPRGPPRARSRAALSRTTLAAAASNQAGTADLEQVTLTIERGVLRSVAAERPVARIALSGGDHAVRTTALMIAGAVAIAVPRSSLAAQAFALASGTSVAPRHLGAPRLPDAGMTVSDALAHILGHLLDVILHYAPAAAMPAEKPAKRNSRADIGVGPGGAGPGGACPGGAGFKDARPTRVGHSQAEQTGLRGNGLKQGTKRRASDNRGPDHDGPQRDSFKQDEPEWGSHQLDSPERDDPERDSDVHHIPGLEPLKRRGSARAANTSNGSDHAHEPVALTGAADRNEAIAPAGNGSADVTDAARTEAVHQMRVAVRRALSAVSICRGTLADQTLDTVRDGLKALGARLGRTRDWDVFVTETLPAITGPLSPDERLDRLVAAAARRRRDYRCMLADYLVSADFRLLGIELAWFIAARFWHPTTEHPNTATTAVNPRPQAAPADPPDDSAAPGISPAVAASVGAFAPGVLQHRWKKLLAAGKQIEALDIPSLHGVRLRAKRARYAAEMFALPNESKAAHRFIRRLSQLQQRLGLLNDGAVAAQLLDELGGPSGRHAYAVGVVIGFTAARAEKMRPGIIHAFGKFRRQTTYWS